MIIRPAKLIRGVARVPGDKSISHRAAILAAMAIGETCISNFSTAEDCRTTLRCLEQLGVPLDRDGPSVRIGGVGPNGFNAPALPLDCGNSGTTARLIAGPLAGQGFVSVLTGDASLSARPMKRIVEPLAAMGAEIDSENGHLPLRIIGRPLHAIHYDLPLASAQVKSCVLLAALLAEGRTSLAEPAPTRDHTERLFRWLGIELEASEYGLLSVQGQKTFSARDVCVPGDMSSSAFLLAAAACIPGSDLVVKDAGVNPTRSAFVDLLRAFGVAVEIRNVQEVCNEPRGTLHVRGGLSTTQKIVISGEATSSLIDELPILAVLGTQLAGGLEVRDASELRHKETDRIAAVVENLRKMGADVREFDDGFCVNKSRLTAAAIESFGDHRIVMALAVAGLIADGRTEIAGAECVDVSFPGFFDTLASVTEL